MAYNDEFGYHEVIHTTHVILTMWETHILGHGVIALDEKELGDLGEQISDLIGEFYQKVSNISDDKFNK